MSYSRSSEMNDSYSEHKNKFTVLVNFAEPNTDQLKTEFESKYGKIKLIRKSGPVYTFIIFEDLVDATGCLEDLKNHPEFQARIPRETPKAKRQSKGDDRDETPKKYEEKTHFRKKEYIKKEFNFEKTSRKSLGEADRNSSSSEINKNGDIEVGSCPLCGNVVKQRTKPPGEERKLVFVKDLQDYEKMKNSIRTMVGVVVANFPIYYMQCDIYTLCKPFAKVLQVDMHNKMIPTEIAYAYVFVESDATASELVAMLDGRRLKGKELRSFKVSDVARPGDIIDSSTPLSRVSL